MTFLVGATFRALVAALVVVTGLTMAPAHAYTIGSPPGDIGLYPSSGAMRVTWADPQYSANYISAIRVDARPGDGSCEVPISAQECTITGLTNGTAYTFAVYAVGTRGWIYDAAVAGPAWPCCSLPDPPANVRAEASLGSAVVSWEPPTNAQAAGNDFTYTVTSTPASGTCTTTDRSCRIDGLEDGTGYSFSVTAAGVEGTGPPGASAPVTPIGPPGAPTGVQVFLKLKGQAEVSWLGPTKTGGVVVNRYVATASPSGATCSSAGALSCTVEGLKNGTSYRFTVTAFNEFGAGPVSASSKVARPLAGPGKVRSVRVRPSIGTAAVSWKAPKSTGGLPITGYVVRSSPSGKSCTTKRTTCTIRGLTGGGNYSFTVQARNRKGLGLVSESSTVRLPQALAPDSSTPDGPEQSDKPEQQLS